MADSDQNKPLSFDELGELDLTPDWARQEPGKVSVVKTSRGKRDSRYERDGRGRSDRRRGAKPSGRREAGSKAMPKATGRHWPARTDAPRKVIENLPLKISFIPERHGLGIIVRRIRSAKMAFPLPAIADLFLKKPEFYMIKVEVEAGKELKLFQCGLCKEIIQGRARAESHLFEEHADEFFEIDVVESEPPSGVFNCMAVCGLTRTPLAPPNHHTYRERVIEVHKEKFPGMQLSEYERKIETVSDQEAIESWKKEVAMKTQYVPKGEVDSEPLDADQARTRLIEDKGREHIKAGDRFVLPAKVAWASKDNELLASYKSAHAKETRFPVTLIHALRPALKHMRLHSIKVGQKETYITAVEPSPVDPSESISPIKEVLEYIKDNPRIGRDKIFSHLKETLGESAEMQKKVLADIHWLVDCGHLIEFSNGTLMFPGSKSR